MLPAELSIAVPKHFGLVRPLTGGKEYGLFKGTLARSLIPVFACVIILVGGLSHPYLARRQAAALQWKDQQCWVGDIYGFTPLEARAVVRLRREFLEAAGEVGHAQALRQGAPRIPLRPDR